MSMGLRLEGKLMTDDKYLDECKDYLRCFIKEFDENKQGAYFFKNFDFKILNKPMILDTCYGKISYNQSTNGDEDGTLLARLIYIVIFGDYKNNEYKLPNLNNIWNSFGVGKDTYGSDTINAKKEVYNIGNFMPLPKGSYNAHTTLNTYRNACYNDDFQEFLKQMKNIYSYLPCIFEDKNDREYKNWKKQDYNETWVKIIKSNEFYFKEINSYQKFIETNLLDDINSRSEKICSILQKRLGL